MIKFQCLDVDITASRLMEVVSNKIKEGARTLGDLYGCEVRALNDGLRKKVSIVELKSLGTITGVKRFDGVRHDSYKMCK